MKMIAFAKVDEEHTIKVYADLEDYIVKSNGSVPETWASKSGGLLRAVINHCVYNHYPYTNLNIEKAL